jgi:hypothetical protein
MLSQQSSDPPLKARRAEIHRAVESRESKEHRKSREQRHRDTQRRKKKAETPRHAERAETQKEESHNPKKLFLLRSSPLFGLGFAGAFGRRLPRHLPPNEALSVCPNG